MAQERELMRHIEKRVQRDVHRPDRRICRGGAPSNQKQCSWTVLLEPDPRLQMMTILEPRLLRTHMLDRISARVIAANCRTALLIVYG